MLGHARRAAVAVLGAAALVVTASGTALAAPESAYTAVGEAVSGGDSLAQAPTLAPGAYIDELAEGSQDPENAYGSGSTLYYRVPVQDGQRLHAAATIAAPPSANGLPEESEPLDLDVSILTASGDTCQEFGSIDAGETGAGTGVIVSARLSETVGEECSGPELFVALTRNGSRDADQPLPVELQVSLETAGTVTGDPAVDERQDRTAASPLAPSDSEPFQGGTSLAGAVEVEPGSYVLELAPGEVSTLRLPVARGQELRWRTEIISDTGESPGSFGLYAFNAAREMVSVDGGSISIGSRGDVQGGSTAAPIEPGNRSSDDSSVSSAWLPGEQLILVQRLERPEGAGDGGQSIRMILTLETAGTATDDTTAADYLELGDWQPGASRGFALPGGGGGLGWGRIAALAGAGLLGLLAVATGVPGLLLLRRRR